MKQACWRKNIYESIIALCTWIERVWLSWHQPYTNCIRAFVFFQLGASTWHKYKNEIFFKKWDYWCPKHPRCVPLPTNNFLFCCNMLINMSKSFVHSFCKMSLYRRFLRLWTRMRATFQAYCCFYHSLLQSPVGGSRLHANCLFASLHASPSKIY